MNGGSGTASHFDISRDGSGGNEFVLSHVGHLTLRGGLTTGDVGAGIDGSIVVTNGTITPSSDRNKKENFSTIDPNEVLTKVLALPVTSWNYKKDDDTVRHIGPMAQDFYASFGLGDTDLGISVTDSAGVAFAAIQGLNQQLEAKDSKISDLEAKLAAQDAKLAAQEARLKALEELLLNK